MTVRALFIVGIVCGASALAAGSQYYMLPVVERPFSPLHELFAPSGLVGQGLGIVGTAMIGFGVVSYALRKRVRALARLGKLKVWLQLHILLCLLGPFLVLLHTTFKFGGLVAIAFWSMAVVVASGVFGRWVYVWIPKTASGRFLGREEIRRRLHGILEALELELGMTSAQVLDLLRGSRDARPSVAGATTVGSGAAPASAGNRRRRSRTGVGFFGALASSVRHTVRKRRERERFHRLLESLGVPEPTRSRIVDMLEEERRIERQLAVLDPFQAAFRYWHAFHIPLATVMLLILIVHVGVAIAFGYTWIWSS